MLLREQAAGRTPWPHLHVCSGDAGSLHLQLVSQGAQQPTGGGCGTGLGDGQSGRGSGSGLLHHLCVTWLWMLEGDGFNLYRFSSLIWLHHPLCRCCTASWWSSASLTGSTTASAYRGPFQSAAFQSTEVRRLGGTRDGWAGRGALGHCVERLVASAHVIHCGRGPATGWLQGSAQSKRRMAEVTGSGTKKTHRL